MRVFVTGGSGFIGQRLVKSLITRGHEAVCLSRSGKASALLAQLGAEVLSGDLTDPTAMQRTVGEARPTHVAHLAAEIASQRNARKVHHVNVDGTRALIDACRNAGLERFLFLSTVVRGVASGETFTENEYIPATTPYGRSKEQGDQMVFNGFSEWGFPGVVLRPSHVYGPGGWFAGLLDDGLFRIPGDGENWWDMVHVDDVVSACALLLERGEPGEAYHVVDDAPVTMNQFFATAAQALGRKPFGNVPTWIAKLIAGKNAVIAATRSAKSSNAKLKQLGWIPAHPRSADAMAAVVNEIRGTVSPAQPTGEGQHETT